MKQSVTTQDKRILERAIEHEQSHATNSDEQAPAVALPTTSVATAIDDVQLASPEQRRASMMSHRAAAYLTTSDTLRRARRKLGGVKRLVRKAIIKVFGIWTRFSTSYVQRMGWYPVVKPYVGYGTEEYSRLICRTVYAPRNADPHRPVRGIRAMLEVPAPGECVRLSIDGTKLRTIQLGSIEVFERNNPTRTRTSDYAISDAAGYLDLLAEYPLEPGVHTMTCRVPHRKPVTSELFTIREHCKVGIISDIDDTIMVTQVPTLWKAAYNLLLMSPRKRASVPGMAVMYNKLHHMFPQAPFFYLSTSPWNVESQIRGFINDYGFPDGPLLLRDLDPRPKTFIPSGVTHKLEYVDQLMADFPDMRFILLGDDGQKDPTTYATIASRYPGRVLAIGIRQLSVREASGGMTISVMRGTASTQPMPETDVPVFSGATGVNIMKTMLPYLEQFVEDPDQPASEQPASDQPASN
ncbi:ABC transporter ATP-binding protein [Bifidobacterium gallicum DSM 20093 = LMG 11596]|uniref:ABC transporter ATP-binding protein n=1 Tax=Bifidobacterium gallicum DSM 20093 = LMG 11596 TaxID=561180 RepID=A0A087AK20_9BIFI|nr:ABC transporter ATP-binding protein [Bifidobacterium gallicum DSM 20093 = LMG 11596]